jgi:hypothetical protein
MPWAYSQNGRSEEDDQRRSKEVDNSQNEIKEALITKYAPIPGKDIMGVLIFLK